MSTEILEQKIEQKSLEEIKIMIQVGKFSFNILHDLINPITGLALYLEKIPDQKMKDNLKPLFEANSEIRNFLKIFQQTVDEPNKKDYVKIDEVIQSSMILIKHKAQKNNVSIHFSRNISNLKIKINRLNLYQILLNLIGNAIDSFKDVSSKKYLRLRKTVGISLSENQNNFRLTVSDNGSGIDKSIIDKIFLNNFTTKNRGFGIGLNTVKNIVENELKGAIKVKSIVGEGTKFHIYIPKSKMIKIRNQK